MPEVVDLAKWVKSVLPGCLVFVGGHSVSFVAEHVLAHAEGAIDVVLKGEGETRRPALLAAAAGPAAGRGARRGHPGRAGAARRGCCTASTITCPPGTWAGGAASTSSA